MDFSPHRIEIRQFKIPPTAFSEQTTKYNVCHYFCLYSIILGPVFKPGARQPQAVRAWFLRIASVRELQYVCVCVSAPKAINN